MKYSEYQVWYHVYTSIATSVSQSSTNFDPQEVISKADTVANYAVEKFRMVEETPQASNLNLDLQDMVDKVLKDAIKKK